MSGSAPPPATIPDGSLDPTHQLVMGQRGRRMLRARDGGDRLRAALAIIEQEKARLRGKWSPDAPSYWDGLEPDPPEPKAEPKPPPEPPFRHHDTPFGQPKPSRARFAEDDARPKLDPQFHQMRPACPVPPPRLPAGFVLLDDPHTTTAGRTECECEGPAGVGTTVAAGTEPPPEATMPPFPDPTRRAFLAATGATLLASDIMRSQANPQDPPLAPPDKQPPDLKVPEPVTKTVGWAVVGLGKLALDEVLPAFAQCKVSRPVALVSGHPDKAKKVAAAYGMDPKNIYDYENYDKLADNPAVQAIYIILPNSMHAEYTIRGLKAGKHVLCEKPMAATVAECEQMIAAAREAKRKLMIAYRLRYEPFNMTAIELCRKGEVGKIKTIVASNGQDVQAPNIRLSKALAGGPVEDIGIYCLNACRYLTGEEPVEVTAFAHQPKDDPRFREVPESVAFTLRFPSGAVGNCDCSFAVAQTRQFRVHGTAGAVILDPAFSYRGLRLTVEKDGKRSELTLTEVNHFAAEMEHFSECILGNKESRTPGDEGLADMRVIAAIAEAARTGKAVAIRK